MNKAKVGLGTVKYVSEAVFVKRIVRLTRSLYYKMLKLAKKMNNLLLPKSHITEKIFHCDLSFGFTPRWGSGSYLMFFQNCMS